jgi:hypothetical protein
MNKKLMHAISEFVTRRLNDLGADAPEAVTEAVTRVGRCIDVLAETLTPEQAAHLRRLADAISLQAGEEIRYYYRAGFYDSVKFLLEWGGTD